MPEIMRPDTVSVERWLATLDWTAPLEAASEAASVLNALMEEAETQRDAAAAALYHHILDWLDERQSPETGLWGAGEPRAVALAAAGELARFYHHVHRPMRAVSRLVDAAIASRPGPQQAPEVQAGIAGLLAAFAPAPGACLAASEDPIWMRLPVGGSARFTRGARVGVVLTCFDLGAWLCETLTSIARQSLKELDLIIVDDGSADPYTVAYLDFLADHGYPVLRQQNAGLAAARNEGIRALEAEYLCCFDADDRMHPEWLSRAAGVLDGDPGLGYVSCYYATFDNESAVYRYAHPSLPEMLVENQTVGVSVFRRAAWDKVSGYCPAFQGMEDWDFWIGILESGYRATLIPEVLFDYRRRPGSMYSSVRQPSTYTANMDLLIRRHRRAFEAWWPEVIRLRVQRFAELLDIRSAETADCNRRIHELEAALAEQEQTIANQEQTVQLHRLECATFSRETASLSDELVREREHMTALKAQQEQTVAALEQALLREKEHAAALDAALSHEREQTALVSAAFERKLDLRGPGPLARLMRNTKLLLSPRDFRRKAKNLGLWCRVALDREKKAIWQQHFDPAWYRQANPDVRLTGVSPVLHYLCYGQQERRAASPDFDTAFYLDRHPDVPGAGLNPLLHYALFGARERRTTAPPVSRDPVPARAKRLTKIAAASAAQAGPLLTVVIPCFNYGGYLREAIDSIQAQTLQNIETIVVEGGSTDGSTPLQVKELEARRYDGMQFLYRTEPHLVGDNRNFAIERARGEYICCLDADDRLKPVYLEVALFLAESYGYDIVYPSVQFFGEAESRWQLNDADWRTIHEYNQIPTVAVFRRSVWNRIGGFRDWAKGDGHVAEDWDFWVRALRHGVSVKCIPAALMLYRIHKNGMWHAAQQTVEFQRTAIAQANAELLATPPPPAERIARDWSRLLANEDTGSPAILLALPFLTIGGAERIFEMVTQSLRQDGRRVIIITTLTLPNNVADNAAHFESMTPHVYPLPALFGDSTAVWDDFVSYLISRYSVETIFIAGSDYLYRLLPDLMSEFPDVSVVDHLFNDQVHFPTNRHFARYIDVTVVPTVTFANRLTEEFGEEPERVAVIPHGVEVPPLPDAADIVELRKTCGLPASFANKCLIGFFGRMSAEKGPDDFVEIARQLAANPEFAFIMTGDGPEFGRVRELIGKYGLTDRIHTPGFVDNVHDLLTSADIVVVPSILDGMPLIVMEAQALAKPVVASSVGSIPAMIQDGETGWLCTPRDSHAFAARIREIYRSTELCRTVGASARRSVETRYSVDAMIAAYRKGFRAAAARRGMLRTSARA